MKFLKARCKFSKCQKKIYQITVISDFKDMCKLMIIVFKLKTAEAPFSNGFVERHNLIIGDMLHKVLEESNIDI